jgi:hypothetical protein
MPTLPNIASRPSSAGGGNPEFPYGSPVPSRLLVGDRLDVRPTTSDGKRALSVLSEVLKELEGDLKAKVDERTHQNNEYVK